MESIRIVSGGFQKPIGDRIKTTGCHPPNHPLRRCSIQTSTGNPYGPLSLSFFPREIVQGFRG
jgi:hypothetical protein